MIIKVLDLIQMEKERKVSKAHFHIILEFCVALGAVSGLHKNKLQPRNTKHLHNSCSAGGSWSLAKLHKCIVYEKPNIYHLM